MDQSPGRDIGGQKEPTVIFNSECPKIVDRFPFAPLHLRSESPDIFRQPSSRLADDFQIPDDGILGLAVFPKGLQVIPGYILPNQLGRIQNIIYI